MYFEAQPICKGSKTKVTVVVSTQQYFTLLHFYINGVRSEKFLWSHSHLDLCLPLNCKSGRVSWSQLKPALRMQKCWKSGARWDGKLGRETSFSLPLPAAVSESLCQETYAFPSCKSTPDSNWMSLICMNKFQNVLWLQLRNIPEADGRHRWHWQ